MLHVQRTNKWLVLGIVGTVIAALLLVLLLLTTNSAGNLGGTPMGSTTLFYDEPGRAPADGLMAGEVVNDGSFAAPIEDVVAQPRDRMILRNATLSVTVENAETSLAEIASMATEMGGWVVTSSTSAVTTADGSEVARGSITVRVPSERLEEALRIIKSGGGRVESESISGEDVTQQYVDLTSRLTNLEAAETQLREIMDSARQTEDVLAVYSELVRVRGEIETLRGQIQYYEESAAFSSISINLIPEALETRVQIAGWSPGRTVERALAALISVLQFVADALIVIAVVILPVALVIGGVVWFIRRMVKRRARAA